MWLLKMNFRRTLLLVILMWSFSNLLDAEKERLLFGGSFDWDDKDAKTGFLFAVSNFNKKGEEAFRLSAVWDVTDIKDSFNLATSICGHMETGVFMLLGGRRFESSNIIESYTQTFHVPYVSYSFADNVQRVLPTYQLHMRPSQTKAIVDLIMHFGWRNFHYVYDSEEGLYRIQEINRMFQKAKYTVNVRMRILQDVRNAHEDLRALDKQDADNTTDKCILLDLSRETDYHNIMRQIREVGMNKHGYHYILGTLDFLNLEMQRYQHGGVNITGFQLVNYSSTFVQNFLKPWKTLDPNIWPGAGSPSIHIDAAFAVDAIEVIQRTLSRLIANSTSIFKHTFRRGEVYNYNKTRGVPCTADPPVAWMHGDAIMQGMKELHFDGVTGNIQFDEFGFRKDYKFDVYDVGLNNGPAKVDHHLRSSTFYSHCDVLPPNVSDDKRLSPMFHVGSCQSSLIGEWSIKGGDYTDGEEIPFVNTTDSSRIIYTVTSIETQPDEKNDGYVSGYAHYATSTASPLSDNNAISENNTSKHNMSISTYNSTRKVDQHEDRSKVATSKNGYAHEKVVDQREDRNEVATTTNGYVKGKEKEVDQLEDRSEVATTKNRNAPEKEKDKMKTTIIIENTVRAEENVGVTELCSCSAVEITPVTVLITLLCGCIVLALHT